MHGELAAVLMMFGVVSSKVNSPAPFSITGSAIQQSITCLIFLHEVDKLEGGMYVVSTNLYYDIFVIKKWFDM